MSLVSLSVMIFIMGEMSEMFLDFDANDMFCRDLDAAVHGRPFVSEDTDYPDSLPLLPSASELYKQTYVANLETETNAEAEADELGLHIKNIKKLAFKYSKRKNVELPNLNQIDMELFINLTSIYVLYANKIYSLVTAKRLVSDRIKRYKFSFKGLKTSCRKG